MSNQTPRPKISIFIATSIDGYIAKDNADIEWLTTYATPTAPEEDKDCGFSKFFSAIDVLVMGRKSYETVAKFAAWPYQGKRVIVLSSSLASITQPAELYSGDATQLVKKLYAEGVKHIYVDGGVTISKFLNAGLVDQMTISILPVVLGSGIPLFSKVNDEKWFRLLSSRAYSNGLVQLLYEIQR